MGTPALPAHDLEPPKFAKLALEHTLKNWRALRSMLVFGSSIDQLELRYFFLLVYNNYIQNYNLLSHSRMPNNWGRVSINGGLENSRKFNNSGLEIVEDLIHWKLE